LSATILRGARPRPASARPPTLSLDSGNLAICNRAATEQEATMVRASRFLLEDHRVRLVASSLTLLGLTLGGLYALGLAY